MDYLYEVRSELRQVAAGAESGVRLPDVQGAGAADHGRQGKRHRRNVAEGGGGMKNLWTIYLLLRIHMGRVAALMAMPRWAAMAAMRDAAIILAIVQWMRCRKGG
jgi:hypothetical protein